MPNPRVDVSATTFLVSEDNLPGVRLMSAANALF